MNRVYLSNFEQIKCNFCTEWFSAVSTFASIQKYSLNACQKCLNNFQYKIVHPDTFEIYDVLLIRTGIKLVNKTNVDDRKNCEKDERVRDLKAEADMHILPIKERVSDVCRKLMDGIIGYWGSCLRQIEKGSCELDTLINKITRGLIENDEENGCIENELKLILEEIHKISSDRVLARIKSFINTFLSTNLLQHNPLQMENYLRRAENEPQTQNKENNTPNKLNNITDIRQKLIKSSRREELKPNSNVKSIREGNSKSSNKSFLNPNHLAVSVNYESISSYTNTSRSLHFENDSSSEKTHSLSDEIRDQIVKNLKEKAKFETYLPVELEKPSEFSNRTYGEKNLIDYHFELFKKTTVDENVCELINENLCKGSITCYLKSLEWKTSISMMRLVKCKMGDLEFDEFLNWLSDKKEITSLVLSNNLFTYLSVTALCNFCLRNPHTGLKQVYLGNNFIKPSKARRSIQALNDLGVQVHI